MHCRSSLAQLPTLCQLTKRPNTHLPSNTYFHVFFSFSLPAGVINHWCISLLAISLAYLSLGSHCLTISPFHPFPLSAPAIFTGPVYNLDTRGLKGCPLMACLHFYKDNDINITLSSYLEQNDWAVAVALQAIQLQVTAQARCPVKCFMRFEKLLCYQGAIDRDGNYLQVCTQLEDKPLGSNVCPQISGANHWAPKLLISYVNT